MVYEYHARPAARGAAVRPPERRSKDCRRRETPSNAPVRAETCEIRNQSAPEVAQRYEALVGPVKARGDGRRARTDAETASPGSPELQSTARARNPYPRFWISTNHERAFAQFEASEASPKAVPAADFDAQSPSGTCKESGTGVAPRSGSRKSKFIFRQPPPQPYLPPFPKPALVTGLATKFCARTMMPVMAS